MIAGVKKQRNPTTPLEDTTSKMTTRHYGQVSTRLGIQHMQSNYYIIGAVGATTDAKSTAAAWSDFKDWAQQGQYTLHDSLIGAHAVIGPVRRADGDLVIDNNGALLSSTVGYGILVQYALDCLSAEKILSVVLGPQKALQLSALQTHPTCSAKPFVCCSRVSGGCYDGLCSSRNQCKKDCREQAGRGQGAWVQVRMQQHMTVSPKRAEADGTGVLHLCTGTETTTIARMTMTTEVHKSLRGWVSR